MQFGAGPEWHFPITSLNKNEVVTVLEFNVGTTNGISWARIQRANGTIGYMANRYLLKCN